jgi:hypothetical protein
MPQHKYEVTLSDGRKFVVEADSQPSEQDVLSALGTQTAQKAEPANTPSLVDAGLMDNPSAGPMVRAGQWLGRHIKAHPVESAAAGGAMLAAPFTGGGSILGGMAAAGLGAAGGAGTAIAGRQLITGKPESAAGTAGTMAKQGALNAAGEGIGRGIVAGANVIVPKVLKGILNTSPTLQKRFPNVVATMRGEKIPVGQSAVADARITESADAVDALLRSKDAIRPKVAGYLGPAREEIALGNPQTTMPKGTGTMVGKIMDGPGGPGAPAGMVDPREIPAALLQRERAELGNRALANQATGELDSLIQSFLQQRTKPMSLVETNAMKRAEQKLSDTAYRAEEAGHPINAIETKFHEGMAGGAQRAVETRVPEVAGMNAQTRDLMGLKEALEKAEMRSGSGLTNLNPVSWLRNLAPGLGSKGAFAADALAQGTQGTTARALRQALVSLLAGEHPE